MLGLSSPLLQSGLLALFTSLALSGFMIHAGIGDEPTARSNHDNVTPTSGGIGIIGGFGMAIFSMVLLYPSYPLGAAMPQVLSLAFAVAALGFLDDVMILTTRLKFALLLLICSLAVWVIGPPAYLPIGVGDITLPYSVSFAGSVLWMFVAINAVNFMDGSNGLMASFMAIASISLALIGMALSVPSVIVLSGALFFAILGFLPYNLKGKALIFAGDSGALFIGFIFAICPLLLTRYAPDFRPLYVGPLILMPFLADTLITMFSRWRKGEALTSPHSSHLYQKLIRKGWPHPLVAIIYMIFGLFCANLALISVYSGAIASLWGLLFVAFLAGFIKVWIESRIS